MESKTGFQVTIKRSETVSAVLPLQEHWLPMSNLDLLLPPLDFGIFLCYPKNDDKDDDENMVAALKKSLAQALVTFYPFAGVIVQNRQGEPEVLCNNRGVDFVHAHADVELKEIDLYRPDMSVQGKLVPAKVNGVLAVQATELRCGGIVIGCTFDHRVADAHSANMFLTAWAETARSRPVTRVPSFRRSLLNPRRPLEPDHEQMDKIYAPLSSIAPPKPQDELVSQIYCVEASEIELLQSQASYNGTKRTKLESFAAFLWKTIAEGGDDEDSDKLVKLGVVVDGRSRLGSKLENYFGNVLSVPYKESTVNNLRTTTLKSAADAVHELISTAASSDHFLTLIDWVELRRPNPGVVRVYCKEPIHDEAAVVVSSGLRFPVKELDFGFGPPGLGSYHFPWGGETGYVMPVPSAKGNGDWVVYAHMSQRHLDLLEARAGHVFRPFAWEES